MIARTRAGAIVVVPFLGIAAATGQPVVTPDPASLALLAYLGVATMAALLAAGLLDERLPWPGLLGGVLILAAVVALHPTEEHPAPA